MGKKRAAPSTSSSDSEPALICSIKQESTSETELELCPDLPETSEGAIDDGEAPAAKKKRERLNLSTEVEEELAEWYSCQELFFDRSVRDFRHAGKKARLLHEKAASLDPPLTGTELEIFFKSMRTQVGKLLKGGATPTKSFTAREQWVVDNFGFLLYHIKRNQRKPRKVGQHSQHSIESKQPEVATYTPNSSFYGEDSAEIPSSVDDKDMVAIVRNAVRSVSDQNTIKTMPVDGREVLDPRIPYGRRTFCEMLCLETSDFDEEMWDDWKTKTFQYTMALKQQRKARQLQQL